MKFYHLLIIVFGLSTQLDAQSKSMSMTNQNDSISYCAGMVLAEQFKSQGLDDLNPDLFYIGFADVMKNNETKVSMEDASTFFKNYMRDAQMKALEKNKIVGQEFLDKNKTKAGVTVTPSGLQYEVITAADGPKPSATDQVTVHYRGTLLDGTEFDSSYKRGEPATFGLNQVIKGWTEGVQLMSPGAKYRFYIPYNLAYGEGGAGRDIGPFSTLIFDVELISIQ